MRELRDEWWRVWGSRQRADLSAWWRQGTEDDPKAAVWKEVLARGNWREWFGEPPSDLYCLRSVGRVHLGHDRQGDLDMLWELVVGLVGECGAGVLDDEACASLVDAVMGWQRSHIRGQEQVQELFDLPSFHVDGCWYAVKPHWQPLRQCGKDARHAEHAGFPGERYCGTHEKWSISRRVREAAWKFAEVMESLAVATLEEANKRAPTAEYQAQLVDPDPEPTCFVYVMAARDRRKIGISVHPEKRAKALGAASGVPTSVIHRIEHACRNDAMAVERELHETFADARLLGEWFEAGPVDAWLESQVA